MKKYKITIRGINVPIIWNVMKKELQDELKELKKDEMGEWEIDKKNWSRKAEFNENGEVIIPERWFKSAIVDSCKKNRIVPHYATRKNATYTDYIRSFMIFNIGKCVCKQDELEEYGAFVGAQGMNSNTKIWRVRPMISQWEATFEIVDAAERIKISELKEIIEFAGMMIGLGDNRINNFGRFELISLVEVKNGE